MAFNVELFKSAFPGGGARPTQFIVTMRPPGNATLASQITFMCKAASLPASVVEPVPAFYFGREIPLSGDRVFPPWKITVYNDESFDVRAMFENWSNGINAMQYNLQSLNLNADQGGTRNQPYKQDIEVAQLSKRGSQGGGTNAGEFEIIREYQLRGAWPNEIGEIRLDWEMKNQLEVFDVTFVYDYWLPTKGAKEIFDPAKAGKLETTSQQFNGQGR